MNAADMNRMPRRLSSSLAAFFPQPQNDSFCLSNIPNPKLWVPDGGWLLYLGQGASEFVFNLTIVEVVLDDGGKGSTLVAPPMPTKDEGCRILQVWTRQGHTDFLCWKLWAAPKKLRLASCSCLVRLKG